MRPLLWSPPATAVPSLVWKLSVIVSSLARSRLTVKIAVTPSTTVWSPIVTTGAGSSSMIVPVASSRAMPSAAVPFTVTPVAVTVSVSSGPSNTLSSVVVSTIVPLAVVSSVTVSVTVDGCVP